MCRLPETECKPKTRPKDGSLGLGGFHVNRSATAVFQGSTWAAEIAVGWFGESPDGEIP